MRPLELVKRKGSVWLCCAAIGLSTSWIAIGLPNAWAQVSPTPASPPGPPQSESLREKSNEELVRLLVGGKSARKLEEQARRANEVKTHLPGHFWEMPSKDAALALVQDNCNLKLKPLLKISLRDENRQPPEKGKVTLHLESGYFGNERETLLELSSDRTGSTLSFSRVELRGPVKRALIEQTLQRKTRCDLPAAEVRRLYEIIWWLGRVHFTRPKQEPEASEATIERVIVTHSVHGKLSVEPGGPRQQEINLCWTSLSECYYEPFDDNLYASFIHFLFQETLKRRGVDSDETTAVLGHETFSSAEEKFVYRTKPPPPRDPATAKWIDRMLRNLKKYPSAVTSRLASIDEPLRYADPRIDDALFRLLRGGLSPHALNPKNDESGFKDAADAARRLAGRKRADAFPIIMKLLEVRNQNVRYAQNDLLQAATLLASTNPEYGHQLIEYLRAQLTGLSGTPHYSSLLFDSVWRGDLRELKPLLEQMATTSPDEIEDERGSSQTSPPRPVLGRFHDARRILVAWREPDPLTKLKLDAVIEVSMPYGGEPAEFLHHEFAALPEDEQREFNDFVQWLEEHRPTDTSWSLESLKKVSAVWN